MGDTKFTPGPWEYENGAIWQTTRECQRCQRVATVTTRHDEGEEEATGRLIAAAPDLLAACEAAYRVCDDTADLRAAVEAMLPLIALARGGA